MQSLAGQPQSDGRASGGAAGPADPTQAVASRRQAVPHGSDLILLHPGCKRSRRTSNSQAKHRRRRPAPGRPRSTSISRS